MTTEKKRFSFIEYLLESKSKSLSRVDEAYQTPPRADLHHGVRLKLSVLKAALENRAFDNDSEVKLVNTATRQIMSCRNEFGWQPGQPEATIQAKTLDAAHPTFVSDLLNDINAIEGARGVLDNITVKIENFSIQNSSNHNDVLLGWTDNQHPNHLWIGVETSEQQLEDFVSGTQSFEAAQDEQPQQQDAAQDANADNGQDPEEEPSREEAAEDEELQEIHGVKFNAEAISTERLAAMVDGSLLPVFVGKWTYDEFKTHFSQLPASIAQHFKPNQKTAANYTQIDWDNSVDSFVKRLGVVMFIPAEQANGHADVIMQLAFNGHPTVVKFRNVGYSYLWSMCRQCSVWYKKIVLMYMDWYKTSRTGIEVLADPDKFFRKNSKYLIQQDPPFTIGLAFQGANNATPQVRTTPTGNNAQSPQRSPRVSRTIAAAAEEQLQTNLSNMMKQKDLAMVQTAFGIPTVKNGMKKVFGGDQGYKMLINFPGVDHATKFVGDEAIQFLKKYNIWDGMYKDLYDAAKAVHDDLQIAVKFDGDLV